MASGNVNRAKRANFQNGPALRQLESAGPLFDCGDLNGRLGNFESKHQEFAMDPRRTP
jgi:hypothetical protein